MAREGVDAVDRALSILTSFRDGDEALGLAELAGRTGLYKSTILRLIVSLDRYHLLYRGDDGRYRLGPETWRLGSLYRRTFDLGEVIRPVLRDLVAATGETASFYVRDGADRVCLYRLNSPRPVRHHLEEGSRLPLDRGAAGRVLLAFSGQTGQTYAAIRHDGKYVSRGERDAEIAAAAVPVFDGAAHLRGVLAVSGLLSRFDDKSQALALRALQGHAEELRRRLPAGDAVLGSAPDGPRHSGGAT